MFSARLKLHFHIRFSFDKSILNVKKSVEAQWKITVTETEYPSENTSFATPSSTDLTGTHSGSNSFIRDDSWATKVTKFRLKK